MKKILHIVFIAIGFISLTHAQSRLSGEQGIYSQHYLNPILINPGAAGFYDHQELLFNYRNTWAGFTDSPRTLTFSYNGPIGNRLGIGALIFSDRFASFETTKSQLSLSYGIESETNKVGFGLSAEYIQHGISGTGLDKGIVDVNDPELLLRLDGTQYFDASFGIYGLYDQQLIYGLSLPSLFSSRISEIGNDNIKKEFSYIFHLGYRKSIEGQDIVIEPSIIAKQLIFTPFHVDINLRADFLEERLTGGLTYTVGADKTVGFLIGSKIDNFGFYYSYNVSSHKFQQYNNGSHELSIKFNLSTRQAE